MSYSYKTGLISLAVFIAFGAIKTEAIAEANGATTIVSQCPDLKQKEGEKVLTFIPPSYCLLSASELKGGIYSKGYILKEKNNAQYAVIWSKFYSELADSEGCSKDKTLNDKIGLDHVLISHNLRLHERSVQLELQLKNCQTFKDHPYMIDLSVNKEGRAVIREYSKVDLIASGTPSKENSSEIKFKVVN